MERCSVLIDWKNYCCRCVHNTQSTLWMQHNPHQNFSGILNRNRKKILKFVWDHLKTLKSQSNREKEQSLRHHISWFQTILQTYSNQNSMILALKTNM